MTTKPPTQIGRYKIDRELGRGTMGVVYEARDTTLGRKVALKTFGTMDSIAPHEREAFERRFLAEARISATIDDQNVVAVYDVGRDFETG
jgi:serine/threonine-protein kinase